MANRRQLVRRRRSVRNIRKITRTMQLISTARFQKALNRATATKPYARKLADMVTAASRAVQDVRQPLLETPDVNKSALIIITSNRGLCGGYNANVLRTAMAVTRERREAGESVELHAYGKKGVNYLRFMDEPLTVASSAIGDQPRFEQVAAVADSLMTAFAKGALRSVDVCYMRFISAGVQRPTVMRLLPLTNVEDEGEAAAAAAEPQRDIVFDYLPGPKELLEELLPATVRMRLFQCFNDAAVSEQVARMVAMKAATDAAGDMIRILTQQYNRARQTAITMELLDIIGGVAAIS
ncbi:MAG TPA: ATP synthase F1 subunit gamma [Phycisphaerae bacterium]|nr:ATP synthase F1 subunit gamma [Phycisphaerales bacterium]HRX85309.1 ATP synthase F1 subunit gamma [Phycisphaerae bacterium]